MHALELGVVGVDERVACIAWLLPTPGPLFMWPVPNKTSNAGARIGSPCVVRT